MNEARKKRPRAPSLDEHEAPGASDTQPTTEHGNSASYVGLRVDVSLGLCLTDVGFFAQWQQSVL